MFDIKLIFAVILVALNVGEIFGHGYMIDPPSRSSAWRRGFNTSINYDDNGVYCGGYGVSNKIIKITRIKKTKKILENFNF